MRFGGGQGGVMMTSEVILASEVKWEKLNPARGDKSPQAGTLWGDRKGAVPTGFLAKFVDGSSSPPHIHNATYRAVVISGRIHNGATCRTTSRTGPLSNFHLVSQGGYIATVQPSVLW